MIRRFTLAICLLALLSFTPTADAAQITVHVQNLAPAGGPSLTPVWFGLHDGTFDLLDIGSPASAELERLAEDGNPEPIAMLFDASAGTSAQGVVPWTGAPTPMPIGPGRSGFFTVDVDPHDPASRYISFASMVIPSNDAFVSHDDPRAHPVFDGLGNFLGVDFLIRGRSVLDAGTEVNDEIPANTAAFGQMSPDTGVDENGVVMPHEGLLPPGSGGIVDDPAFPHADFSAPGYVIARVRVTFSPGTVVHFPLSGDQEVPPVVTDASGVCRAVLSPTADELHLYCEHDVENATAAHIHVGAPGANGPVIFDLGDPSSPIDVTLDVTASNVAQFLSGNFYVNIHTPENPDGEIRGQITGCFDTPTTLCLNEGRFQVSARYASDGAALAQATAFEEKDDSGFFTFAGTENIELVVKVLNGCAINDHYWVFAGGLTNQRVELTVTDTLTGEVNVYTNEDESPFLPIQDTDAFDGCDVMP